MMNVVAAQRAKIFTPITTTLKLCPSYVVESSPLAMRPKNRSV
jgi:hypothetical protein